LAADVARAERSGREAPIELVVKRPGDTEPLRLRVDGTPCVLGSADDADLKVAGVPPAWLVLRRESGGIGLREAEGGGDHALEFGEQVTVDGITIALVQRRARAREPLPVGRLADALATVEGPDEALRLLLDFVVETTGADLGAVILAEDEGFRIAAARGAKGEIPDDAANILSHTVVRDVLRTGRPLRIGEVKQSRDYGREPSIVALRLRSVLCLPMTLGGRVLGTFYLDRRGGGTPFPERHTHELSVIAALAVPFLVQLGRPPASAEDAMDALVGDSPELAEVRRLVERIAPTDLCVLLQGETGTGKEVTAKAIHAKSPRAARPLVAVNCSAVPEALLEAELFGAKKGAFTGAVQDRKGRIEAADGSTLLLDEVGDMPLPMQAALLRALEEREIVRVGDTEPRQVDFRLIASTNKDLDTEVAAGRFREDLLFRIREVTVTLPPLRSRGDDVLLLARLFLRQAERQLSLRVHAIGPDAERALCEYPWPGNVRELRSMMRRVAVLADRVQIDEAALRLTPKPIVPATPAVTGAPSEAAVDAPAPTSLREARDEYVRQMVEGAMTRFGGDALLAARSLGISLRSLYRYRRLGRRRAPPAATIGTH
jgi:transcriptional regulator with GAF, ATPase, and Fis domain